MSFGSKIAFRRGTCSDASNVFVTPVLADMHERLKPYYSEIGRPSVDPDLMIRMLIVGYCYGLRSERRLTQEVELHLAYRWFCRLDLDDKVPHHSTFSENRLHRFRESDVFRHIFERVVVACMAAGDRPKRCCHASAATGAHIAFGADHMLGANPSRLLDRNANCEWRFVRPVLPQGINQSGIRIGVINDPVMFAALNDRPFV